MYVTKTVFLLILPKLKTVMTKKTVSVYGYGRFGKLWAEILADDFHVQVYSRRGLKREEVREDIEIVSEEQLFNCDAIFFTVAISAFEELLINSKKYFRKETVYIDTCSVKVMPVKWMTDHIPAGCEIIATHPMFGPDSYGKSENKLAMVMSNVTASENNFSFWTNYFATKPMRIEIMSPEQHDQLVAYSQGITHFVGRVLSDLHLSASPIDTLGYTRLLDIIQQTCNDNWQLFLDLQKYNPYTQQMRAELQASLANISAIFENGEIK